VEETRETKPGGGGGGGGGFLSGEKSQRGEDPSGGYDGGAKGFRPRNRNDKSAMFASVCWTEGRRKHTIKLRGGRGRYREEGGYSQDS